MAKKIYANWRGYTNIPSSEWRTSDGGKSWFLAGDPSVLISNSGKSNIRAVQQGFTSRQERGTIFRREPQLKDTLRRAKISGANPADIVTNFLKFKSDIEFRPFWKKVTEDAISIAEIQSYNRLEGRTANDGLGYAIRYRIERYGMTYEQAFDDIKNDPEAVKRYNL